jgi:hypothetical protein
MSCLTTTTLPVFLRVIAFTSVLITFGSFTSVSHGGDVEFNGTLDAELAPIGKTSIRSSSGQS